MTADDLPGSVAVLDDPAAVAAAAAALVTGAAAQSTATSGEFDIALAGGATPRALYELLAAPSHRELINWGRVRIWFGDERAGAADNPVTNFAMARAALLDHVPIGSDRIHRMPADQPDLDAAAAEYSALLAKTLPATAAGAPRLEMVLLGLGENGHTASLFPQTPAVEVLDAWATRGLADYEPRNRITLTFPTINAAAAVVFLVTGATKGAALRGIVDGTVPAAQVRPADGDQRWLLDSAAAAAMARE